MTLHLSEPALTISLGVLICCLFGAWLRAEVVLYLSRRHCPECACGAELEPIADYPGPLGFYPTCPEIDLRSGDRCSRVEGHPGLHTSGSRMWRDSAK